VGTVQYGFENFSVSGAIAPTTGESFFLERPQLTAVNFQIFLHELAQHYQDTLNRLLLGNGSCHTANALVIPDNVVCLCFPPYSPERNPIERLWQEMKAPLAWVLAAQSGELAHRVEAIIRRYSEAVIRSLTAFPSFVHAVNALYSSRNGITPSQLMQLELWSGMNAAGVPTALQSKRTSIWEDWNEDEVRPPTADHHCLHAPACHLMEF
jgi:transposase